MEEVKGSIPFSSTEEGPGHCTWAFVVQPLASMAATSATVASDGSIW